jgi:hypothetical protein
VQPQTVTSFSTYSSPPPTLPTLPLLPPNSPHQNEAFYEGQFVRPKGRAPKGCDWDSTQGCWFMEDGTPLFVGEKKPGTKAKNLAREINFRGITPRRASKNTNSASAEMNDGWGAFTNNHGVVRPSSMYTSGLRPLTVVVVGAGIAGLACARELLSRGHKVLVVEGRRRVGGRLNTAHLKVSGGGRRREEKKRRRKCRERLTNNGATAFQTAPTNQQD